MKTATLICTFALVLLATTVHAESRTTRLGEMDATADASLLQLLKEAPHTAGVQLAPVFLASQSGRSTADLSDVAVLRGGVGTSEVWLMLLVGAGLVAFQLRRRQKALAHRPLSGSAYR